MKYTNCLAGLLGLLVSVGVLPLTNSYAQDDTSKIIEELGLIEAPTPMREMPSWRAPKKILAGFTPVLNLEQLNKDLESVEIITIRDWSQADDHIKDADAIIGMCAESVISKAPNLQWLHVSSAGVEDCVNNPTVQSSNFVITNMQKVTSSPIGEHVMGMILSFSRNLQEYEAQQKDKVWAPSDFTSLKEWEVGGKTILIVGLGGIGKEVAKRAKAFDMRVTATRNSRREGPDYVDYVGLSDELLTLAADADVVVNATPLTTATTNLFDASFFETMKKSAIFINVGRGKSVVTDDLVTALNEGIIGGAGLDVTEPEPLPADHPLWTAKNVLITPHVATRSDVIIKRYVAVLTENVKRYANGDALYSIVDRERQY